MGIACLDERINVTYHIISDLHPDESARRLAIEQSTGGEGRHEYAANVEKVEKKDAFSEVVLSFPIINLGYDIDALTTTVIGEIHNIKDLYARVVDIEFSEEYVKHFHGPKYGISGIRNILDVKSRPLLCGPVKPCVGLTPHEFANRAYEAMIGGFDIIKDDELFFDIAYCPLEERVKRTMESLHKAEHMTGEKKLYILNASGHNTQKYIEIAEKYDASGFLICPAVNGLSIAQKIPRIVLGHNSLFYASSRGKNSPVDFSVWCKIQRLAGVDIMIMPAPYGSFEVMTGKDYVKNADALTSDLFSIKSTFPSAAGSQGIDTMERLNGLIGHDYVLIVGKKLYGSPKNIRHSALEIRRLADRFEHI